MNPKKREIHGSFSPFHQGLKNTLLIILASIIALVAFSLIAFFQTAKLESQIADGEMRRYHSHLLADELRQSSDDLTRMARLHLVTGEEKYREYFKEILGIRNGTLPRPRGYNNIYWDFVLSTGKPPEGPGPPKALKSLMKEAGFTELEFSLLEESERESNNLAIIENEAMNAVNGLFQDETGNYTRKGNPDPRLAYRLMHGQNYNKAKASIMKPIEKFFQSIEKRTRENLSLYRDKQNRLNTILQMSMGLTLLLLLVSLLLVKFSPSKKSTFKAFKRSFNIGKTLFFIFSSVMVSIIFAILTSFSIVQSEKDIAKAERDRFQSYLLADELRQSSDDLTNMARLFVLTGLNNYRDNFETILSIRNGKASRPKNYHNIYWDFVLATGKSPTPLGPAVPLETLMREAGFVESEFTLLQESEKESNALVAIENRAMDAAEKRPLLASSLLHGEDYHQAKTQVMRPIEMFFKAMDKRTADTVKEYRDRQEVLALVLSATLIVSFLFLLSGGLLVAFSSFEKKQEASVRPFLPLTSFQRDFLHNWPFISLGAVIIFFTLGFAWWSVHEVWIQGHKLTKEQLEKSLETAHSTTRSWIEKIHSTMTTTPTPLLKKYIIIDAKGAITSSSYKNLEGSRIPLLEQIFQSFRPPYTQDVYFLDEKAPAPLAKNIIFVRLHPNKTGADFFIMDSQKSLNTLLRSSFPGQTGKVYLLNGDGRLITDEQGQGDPTHLPLPVNRIIQRQDSTGLHGYKNFLGERVQGLWKWDNTYGFGVVVEMSSREALSFIENQQYHIFLGSTFTVFLILMLAIFALWKREQLRQVYAIIKRQNDKFTEDLEIGQKVQLDMLPGPITGEGFAIDAILSPARVVAGDFYDFSLLGKKQVFFCLGDVSGKGVPAALFMMAARAFLRKSLNPLKEPGEVLARLNKELARNNERCMFVTLVLGIMDLETGVVSLSNAGHNPCYIKRKSGKILCLQETQGPFVGPFEEAEFSTQAFTLSKGEILLAYSDGVTEAQNTDRELYGEKRLEEFLTNRTFSSPETMTRPLLEDISSFTGEAPQFDDITILGLQYY